MFLVGVALLGLTAPGDDPWMTYDPNLVVSIEVLGDGFYTRPHVITIRARGGRVSPSPAEPDDRAWDATREWEGGSQTLDSAECPALRAVAISVGDLPPVRIAPANVISLSDDDLPLPPAIKDGFTTSLTFPTITGDGSKGQGVVRGGDVYQRWGHDAVASLIGCWGPLAP